MKPTSHLRFVERVINICTSPDGTVSHGTKVRILQQWWALDPDSYTDWVTKTNGYWCDIPLEKEE